VSVAPPAHRFVVITGLSGSGKSLVHRCFEDMGFFCVDNLPVELVQKFAEIQGRSGEALERVALTIDVREREFLAGFPAVYQDLKARDPDVQLLFLEADDPTLVRRFSETRRPHPLATQGRPLAEAIAEERALLMPLRHLADVVLDTRDYTGPELRTHLLARYATGGDRRMLVNLVSFGYKHGLPREADIVLDVRFVTNPFHVEGLRHLSGQDAPVREYLESQPEYLSFLSKLEGLLDFLLPQYEKEGKSYLTIALGCTGGRHRSVAAVERLAPVLERRGLKVVRSHRDRDIHGG
jgi:UPF0042 nucleotide-binding protein